ncbi:MULTISPECIES: transposase [Nitrosomonas]|uniref:DDE family transposase n=1 Tax=Nitrosomonas communis TaxID=44574 RepID=A0A5D3Y6P3_9PROT|nr:MULTISPECIES: transposase [Nitrosomonas]TYP70031.1 DDE family transposase [Nitrosomonas communis]UVS62461.1 transposase [Nitrosomonas sp. PLL12]
MIHFIWDLLYDSNGARCTTMADAKRLYRHHIRKQWQSIQGTRYRYRLLDVGLNLASSLDEAPQWVPYRLLFVKGTTADNAATSGKHDWTLFITTDTTIEASRILEIYALRWGIEVYFKESKRHLGLLMEQNQ